MPYMQSQEFTLIWNELRKLREEIEQYIENDYLVIREDTIDKIRIKVAEWRGKVSVYIDAAKEETKNKLKEEIETIQDLINEVETKYLGGK